MGTDGNYCFTSDGTFIDVVPTGAQILGPGVGRQVFVFGDDGQTRLLGEGSAQLAELSWAS